MHEDAADMAATETPPRLRFDLIKSNFFRVIHSDGAWGGITPQGKIHMAFYNERPAIPKQVTHEVTAEGNLGAEIADERIARDAIVREVEVEVIMDLETAKRLREWLDDKIQRLGQALADLEARSR